MKINSLKKVKQWKGKIVFLRLDFNVPISKGKVLDDYRLKAGLETVDFLREKGARIIIASHLGEPAGKPEKDYSLKPVAACFNKLSKEPAEFLADCIGSKIKETIIKMQDGEIVMLENLRFHQEEYDNDPHFAKQLAELADIYINDAFAVSHRDQASVSAIKKYLPSYAGLLLEKEVTALNRVLKPKKPLVVVMGGAKIHTKVPLMSKLYPLSSQILLGGAMANNFFKFQKLDIGQSLFDKDSETAVKKFFKRGKVAPKIILPIDVVVKDKNKEARVKDPSEVKKEESILDIGPKTISLYASYIKKAKTLVWNGPLGKFEEPSFKHGTMVVARLVAARSSGRAYGVVGGGETIEALKLTKMQEYVDWVSTAGGATLAYLGGVKMPGLTKIVTS